MMNIKRALSELRGVLGGYGFAQPKTESTKGAYPFGDKEKQYRAYSDAELAYARTDASDAAKNMKGHDTSAENWYQDDASTINQEIERRRGKKTKTEASTKVGDRATITGGNKKYVGKQGTISGVTGSEQPFHWQIKLDDGPEGVWKGDEFNASSKTEGDTNELSLEAWAAKQPVRLQKKGDAWSIPDDTNLVDRSAAWRLSDYLVSSVTGGSIWFSPRKAASGPVENEVEARAPSAYGSMSSGRYIGQVLGNVISDIEKGHHEDAVTLLRKLKTDLEKAGTEVVELWGEGK